MATLRIESLLGKEPSPKLYEDAALNIPTLLDLLLSQKPALNELQVKLLDGACPVLINCWLLEELGTMTLTTTTQYL